MEKETEACVVTHLVGISVHTNPSTLALPPSLHTRCAAFHQPQMERLGVSLWMTMKQYLQKNELEVILGQRLADIRWDHKGLQTKSFLSVPRGSTPSAIL